MPSSPVHLSSARYCDRACSWSLGSLIGSYLDLALAYLLLIGSTLAFLAFKFLSLFGLALPCSCDPLVSHPPHCIRSHIASIHASIQTRFPFAALAKEGGSNNQRPPIAYTGSGNEEDADDIDGVVIGKRAAPANAVRRIRRRRKKGKASSSYSLTPPLRFSWQAEGALVPNFDIGSKSTDLVDEIDDGHAIVDDLLVDEAPPDNECSAVNYASSRGNENLELVIKILERELEEAQSSHAALYIELEKERSAAASAADEAMAMILRLQKEKATVEMESRQYQRMIEEKSAFDEEEMEILKEIIVRRELENHVLEKKLEVYHRGIAGKKLDYYSFDLSEDPMVMPKDICKSNSKNENPSKIEFQEKGIVAAEVYPSEQWQSSSRNKLDGLTGEENEDIKSPSDELELVYQYGYKRGSNYSLLEIESHVLDVHVVDDKSNSNIQEQDAKGNSFTQVGCVSNISRQGGIEDEFPITSDIDVSAKTPLTSGVGVDQDTHGSFSDITKGSELIGDSSGNALRFDLRRRSMSVVDSERNKLETEVEVLRKRLKAIQQGRENLSFSVAYKEKEASQLLLLEEIAYQLQEIRKMTEPRNSMRRASLPPLLSKGLKKKAMS